MTTTVTLDYKPVINTSQELFEGICQENPELRLERTQTGELVIMAPTGGETGRYNAEMNFQFKLWNKQVQLGVVFDSSTGFILPNGANRAPDVAWLTKSRWNSLTTAQKEKFIPLCPDFVLELLSPNDSLKTTQAKMREYIANGSRLGWLINRKRKEVEIYRPGKPVEVVQFSQSLSGEDVLPGFTLNLQGI